MQDKDLYQQILGLSSPWSVRHVELNHEQSEIQVRVDHPRGTKFGCPECDAQLACHDHTEERRWRHLDSCQFKAILIARIPRVKCPTHGVKNATIPWAEKHSRFTIMFERFAIDVLLATQAIKGAMSILDTKWDQTWNMIQRAVRRGKQRKQASTMPRIGIDEKAFKKGHSYITLLYDWFLRESRGNDVAAEMVEGVWRSSSEARGPVCFLPPANWALPTTNGLPRRLGNGSLKRSVFGGLAKRRGCL